MKILEDVYLVGSGQIGISHSFDCHVYLIDGGDELALVDSGAGVEVGLILSNIAADGLDLGKIRKMLLTHHHADHSGGCSHLQERLDVESYLHKNCVAFVARGDEDEMGLTVAKRSGLYSPNYIYHPFEVSHPLNDREVVSVGRYTLEAYHVPGHSPDATCYLMNTGNNPVLFTGDVVFFGGRIGLLNRSGSNLEDYRKNLSRLVRLPFESMLPGHGVFVLKGGKKHVETANIALQKLQPPLNFI
jgi:glyoxylase-like metal-dependent hydrolase (beta-lactamase superfamily II)